MSSIKVIDINEEAKQEAIEEPVEIEETKEEVVEPTNEVVDNTPVEEDVKLANSSHELCVKEEVVEKPKAKAKPKPTDKVDCKNCGKTLSYKNYRYRHEKICTEEPKPVKPQANPKGKSKPKPQPIVKEVYEEEEEEEPQPKPKPKLSAPVSNQILKPQTPNLVDFASHYQLLQNQFIQQKKDKYNVLCQNMFSSKSKKR